MHAGYNFNGIVPLVDFDETTLKSVHACEKAQKSSWANKSQFLRVTKNGRVISYPEVRTHTSKFSEQYVQGSCLLAH